MSQIALKNVYLVDFKRTLLIKNGSVTAIPVYNRVAENEPIMQRPSVYPYDVKESPGANVHRLRNAYDWSMRTLADKCHPPLEHTTIRRLEHNMGYTQDTLERVAKALGVSVYELFLPPELADWPHLPQAVRARLAESVQDAAAAARYRAKAK